MRYSENYGSVSLNRVTASIMNVSVELDKIYNEFNTDYSNDDRIDGFFYSTPEEIQYEAIGETLSQPSLMDNIKAFRDELYGICSNTGKKFFLKFVGYAIDEDNDGSFFERLSFVCENCTQLTEEEYRFNRITFNKAYNYFKGGLSDFVEIDKIDYDNLDYALTAYASDNRFDMITYLKDLKAYMDTHRITLSNIVEENEEFFEQCVQTGIRMNSIVADDFYSVSEAVMFYDYVLLKAGKLIIDLKYIERLKTRLDNPQSVYNSYETIMQVEELLKGQNKLTTSVCLLLYNNEDLIDDNFIDDVLQGQSVENVISQRRTNTTNFFK